MLYQFLLNYVDTFGFLNVFKYLTFRTGLSVFTSLFIVLMIGGPFIRFFSNQKILIKGPPIIKTIIKDVITDRPVLKVKYLKTLKKEYCSIKDVKK